MKKLKRFVDIFNIVSSALECDQQKVFNSRFPLLRILNTTTMILCGYFLHYAITCPKSMLVVVFRIRNKGNRLLQKC